MVALIQPHPYSAALGHGHIRTRNTPPMTDLLGAGGYCSQGNTVAGTTNGCCGGSNNWGDTDLETWYALERMNSNLPQHL